MRYQYLLLLRRPDGETAAKIVKADSFLEGATTEVVGRFGKDDAEYTVVGCVFMGRAGENLADLGVSHAISGVEPIITKTINYRGTIRL